MVEKNHGIWANRPAVQKAFDADPQHAYNCIAKVLSPEQAAQLEAMLCPPPTVEQQISFLNQAKEAWASVGIDTAEIDRKISELTK